MGGKAKITQVIVKLIDKLMYDPILKGFFIKVNKNQFTE